MHETAINADVGLKLRQLRLERNSKQADVARELGISPAYLNLIEKGKRAVPFPLLWRALKNYGEDPEKFMANLGGGRADAALEKLLDDELVKSLAIDPDGLAHLSAEPKLAGTVAALFNLYKNTRSQLENVMARATRAEGSRKKGEAGESLAFDYSPFDEVTDFLQAHHNYFPEVEAEADRLRRDHALSLQLHSEEVKRLLEKEFHVKVELRDFGHGSSVVHHLDPERRVLALSTALPEQRLKFQMAAAVGVLALDRMDLLETLENGASTRPAARAGGQGTGAAVRHHETPTLIKINLANYLAGALMLPYGPFFAEVQRSRYDIEHLAQKFNVSYETVAHRTCNLADPRRRGVPFHFVRADVAGNISKRYSATGLRFPPYGGSCGKWAVHNAFLTPSVINRQYSRMPDGASYFCFAKVVTQPIEGSLVRGTVYSIGLGTHASDAKHLAYSRGLPVMRDEVERVSVPVGPACRFCDRPDCNQRAAPSYKFAFAIDEYTKKDCFFSPLLNQEARAIKARR